MAYVHTIFKYPDEILSLPMFHAEIHSREKAEWYVNENSQGCGSYIVRPNTQNDPSYVSITIRQGSTVNHVRVYIERSRGAYKYYILEKNKFSSFRKLLTNYQRHRIHCLQEIDNLRLRIPLTTTSGSKQEWGSLNNIGEDYLAFTGSSSSDDTQTGSINTAARDRPRSHSAPHVVAHDVTFNGVNMQKETMRTNSLTQPIIPKHSSEHLNMSHSQPQFNHPFTNTSTYEACKNEFVSKIGNSLSTKQDLKTLMKTRPMLPLPEYVDLFTEEGAYYSSTETSKHSPHEIYEIINKNERCECGLWIEDSQFPLGWTIHCSKNPETLGHVYFQRSDIKTWKMPDQLVDKLTIKQLEFIIRLYRDNSQPMPLCLRSFLDRVLVPTKTSSHTSTLTSSGEDPSSSSTSLNQVHLSSSSADIHHSSTAAAATILNSTTQNKEVNNPKNRTSSESNTYGTPENALVPNFTTLNLSLPAVEDSNESFDSINFDTNSQRRISFNSIPTITIPAKIGSPSPAVRPAVRSSDKLIHQREPSQGHQS